MRTTQNTIPSIATHPGEILLDELNTLNIAQSDFALSIGINRSQLNEVIKGKRNINADLSLLLEKAIGIDADYWLEVQKNYDLDTARIKNKNQKRLEALEQWEMIKDRVSVSFFKREKLICGDPIKDLPCIKSIYNVQSMEELVNLSVKPEYARFRKSEKLKIDPVNIIGWVKLVQYKANREYVNKFSYEERNELFTHIKNILFENDNTLNRIKTILSDFGIKLIYQQNGEKTPVDGISFWSEGNPAIGMSLRHKRLDNFAFTLFHELGHIFQHLVNNSKAEFIDLIQSHEVKDQKNKVEEKEADKFAQDHLIDPELWSKFKAKNVIIDDVKIRHFANEIKIHPSIIWGRFCYSTGQYNKYTSINNKLA